MEMRVLAEEGELFSHTLAVKMENDPCKWNYGTETDVKAEDTLSDFCSQNKKESFSKETIENESVKCSSDCEIHIKTEIADETEVPDLFPKKERACFTKEALETTKFDGSLCSSEDNGDNKLSDFYSQKETDPVSKTTECNVLEYELDTKVEIKDEFLEQQAKPDNTTFMEATYEDISPAGSPRSNEESVLGVSICDSALLSSESSEKCIGLNMMEKTSEATVMGNNICSGKPTKCNDAVHSNKCKVLYMCEICGRSFTQMWSLKSHYLIHEGKKPYRCCVCEKSFTQLSAMKRHKVIHEDKRPHKCNICEKDFRDISTLKRHFLIHENQKPHKCKVCGKSFTLPHHLKKHSLLHEKKRLYECNICENTFTQLKSLKMHNFTHYQCHICKKGFINLWRLKRHNLVHEGKKPHKCNLCGISFTQLYNLKKHILRHKKHPYKCDVCEKSFTYLPKLKLHNLIHEGKGIYKCEICEKYFSSMRNLKRHNLIHESKMQDKQHKCDVCEKCFRDLWGLKRHSVVHKDKISENADFS